MIENNKFAYTALHCVKENIIKNNEPLSNPIILIGLDKGKRYRIFWSIFNKDFNSKYRNTLVYKQCTEIDLGRIQDKRLIIVENIETLINEIELQNKIQELLNICFKQKNQVVLCSNIDIKELEIDEILKSKLQSGLTIYLNDIKTIDE